MRVSEPYSDPENSTIYRSTLVELANDTFVSEDKEMDHTHETQLDKIHNLDKHRSWLLL